MLLQSYTALQSRRMFIPYLLGAHTNLHRVCEMVFVLFARSKIRTMVDFSLITLHIISRICYCGLFKKWFVITLNTQN
jgi:hypothetical protein